MGIAALSNTVDAWQKYFSWTDDEAIAYGDLL